MSKTVGTRIQNGFMTIHETSVIGTTIDGQYAHFVQSIWSTVFQEPAATATVVPPGLSGSVEVVTELPYVNSLSEPTPKQAVKSGAVSNAPNSTTEAATTESDDRSHFSSFPLLESHEYDEPEQRNPQSGIVCG